MYLQYVRYPPKRLLGSGFSTPCTAFCLICTINSELTSCLICTHLSELGLISADFSGRVRHPLDSRKLFVRAYSHMNIYMTCSVSTPRVRLVTKRPNLLHIRKGVSKEPYIHSKEPYVHSKEPSIQSTKPYINCKRALYTLRRVLDFPFRSCTFDMPGPYIHMNTNGT